MLPFATKPLDEWTADDLQSLVTQGIEEGQRIEYKRDPYGGSDDDRRELLKDISSIANGYGGHLFIGIDEDDGRPTNVLGIDKAETHATGLVSSCLASIEPTLTGLTTRLVPLAGGRQVLVVAIPRSNRAPHMVTFKGLNQFWVRHDRRKDRMSVDEIREAFLRSRVLMEDLRTFLGLRRDDLLDAIGPTTPLYVLAATPLDLTDEVVNIFDTGVRRILHAPKDMRPGGRSFRMTRHESMQPTLDGLRRQVGYGEELEVFRNGHLEARIAIEHVTQVKKRDDGTEQVLLAPFQLAEYLVSFCRFASEMRAYLGLQDPCFLNVWLFNLQGYRLANGLPGDFLYGDDVNLWNRRHLLLPALQVADLSNPDAAARERADRLWQAFGWERSPVFKGDEFNAG